LPQALSQQPEGAAQVASQQLGAQQALQQLLHFERKRSSKHGLQHFTLQQLEGAQQEEGAAQLASQALPAAQVASQQPLPAAPQHEAGAALPQQEAGAAQVASQQDGLQHLLW